jgi:phage terminase large subunit GpA-like protein
VTFTNGVMIRFMSKGGSDKARAGFSGCRVVAITETDGMDEPGETSREADMCEQIQARARGYAESQRVTYLECTASIPEGKIWREYTAGTCSRLVRPCPYCEAWVTPERENLKGWQDAVDEEDARQKSAWHCPECDHAWTETDRRKSWQRLVLVHRGQEVTPEGQVVGPVPRTRTLGFRWGAIDNPFTDAGTCGVEEWKALRESEGEKEGWE